MITITVIDHGMSLSVLYDLTHWATQAPIFSRYMFNLVITRFHKILLITLRHITVLHEDITYIQYYMAKWSYIIKNIKTYQQFSLWTMITFYKLLHYKKIGDHSGIIFLKMRGFVLCVDNQLVMSSTCYLFVVMNI
jgi:hypothetical protein